MDYRIRMRFKSFLNGLDVARRIFSAVFLLILAVFFLGMLISRRPPRIPRRAVLTIQPCGALVESYSSPVSYRGIPLGPPDDEVLLADLVGALDAAAADSRITGVFLSLDDFLGGGVAAQAELAEALGQFAETGKPVIADADYYDTGRYRIASEADVIIVDRLGEVFPTGYGSWRAYYAEGLEKLGAEINLFRSGPSKSAGDPFIRDSMSDEARRDSGRLLSDLWDQWLEPVAENRGIETETLKAWIESYDVNLVEAGGDHSLAALNASLVDEVETGGVLDKKLTLTFGDDPHIDVDHYLGGLRRPSGRLPSVAIVPVSGILVYGPSIQDMAGSRDVAAVLDAAAASPGVEALVLRIDSPGGDVRAGEEIRRTLERIRTDDGLPVVASMGSMAASGGYWIAVESDWIISRPETITGSIGVYNLSVTFEEALKQWLGIHIDGLGTTPWSGMRSPARSLNERSSGIYSTGVKDIDVMFRSLVADKRGMDPEDVDAAAGGIPWSGVQALNLGLVDELGGLNKAVLAAAEMAELTNWKSVFFDKTPDAREQLWSQIIWGRFSHRAAAEMTVLGR